MDTKQINLEELNTIVEELERRPKHQTEFSKEDIKLYCEILKAASHFDSSPLNIELLPKLEESYLNFSKRLLRHYKIRFYETTFELE
jgi:hypothetical protein